MPLIGTNTPNYTLIPSTFKTLDIELLSPIMGKLNIHLTKSTKRDHIYKLCLYTLEEHKCLIFNNLSYTSKNRLERNDI